MTNRETTTTWLKASISDSGLESLFRSAGFVSRNASLSFCRNLREFVQQFKIVFDAGPRYEPTAVAHVLPQIVIESSVLGDLVQQMTKGHANPVPGDTSLVLRHQLQNMAPNDRRHEATRWFIRSAAELPLLLDQIRDFSEAWAIPFLDRYRDPSSLAQGYESEDERLHLDRRFYLYVAAAYLHLGQPKESLEVLEKWFGRPALRKQFAFAFEYVRRRQRP